MTCTIENEEDNDNSPVYLERSFDDTFYLPEHFSLIEVEPGTPTDIRTKYIMKTYLNEHDRINEIAWINMSCDLAIFLGYESDGYWYMFENPEIKDFNWTIDLKDSFMEPGMKIWEEIEKTKDSFIVQADWIFKTQKVFSIAQKSCSLIRNFNQFLKPVTDLMAVWSATNAAIGAFAVIPGLDFLKVVVDPQEGTCSGGFLGSAKCTVDGWVDAPTKWISENVFNIGIGGEGDDGFRPISTMCDWIQCTHCDEEGAFRISGLMGQNFDTSSNAEPEPEVESDSDDGPSIGSRIANNELLPEWDAGTADWKNSFIASANCGCIPGIITKLQEWRQIDCNYMTCLKDKSTMGLSVSDCKLDRSRFMCNYWMGELTVIGPMRAMDAYLGAIADSIASLSMEFNLATIITGTVGYVACEWLLEEKKGIVSGVLDATLCKVPMAVNMAKRTVQQFNSTFNNFKEGSYWENYLDSINPLSVPDIDACEPWVD